MPENTEDIVDTPPPDIVLAFCSAVNKIIKVIFKQEPSRKALGFTRKGRDFMALSLQA